MIRTLAIDGYRSLRDVVLELSRLSIVTGPNGSGKSSLYRALQLLADVAQGRVIGSLAAEGGLESTLWAGPEKFSDAMKQGHVPVQGTLRRAPVSLRLGFASDDYGYAIDLGLPVPTRSRFAHDPEIKAEAVWTGPVLRPASMIANRRGPRVKLRTNSSGGWRDSANPLAAFDSMMTHCADPEDGFELLFLRERMRNWRFYDHFRTDRDAPARKPQVGTFTPVLAGDGSDLGAAIQTIFEIGNERHFRDAIADAFAGAELSIGDNFEVLMRQHGVLRPLRASELSDGTLRYLLLVTALLSPRPPELMILNEPENSLHPDLLNPLARLLALASASSQLIVVSHARSLVEVLSFDGKADVIELDKELGETVIRRSNRPSWHWPDR